MTVTMAKLTPDDKDNKRRTTLIYIESKSKTYHFYQLCGKTKSTIAGFLYFGGQTLHVVLRKIMKKSFVC